MSKFLTKPKFVAWLQKQPKRKAVGISDRTDCCPIANYLHAVGVAPEPRVGQDRYRVVGEDGIARDFPLPRWARAFVRRVDAGAGADVLPDQALAFLGIKRKEVKRVAKTKKNGTGKKGC